MQRVLKSSFYAKLLSMLLVVCILFSGFSGSLVQAADQETESLDESSLSTLAAAGYEASYITFAPGQNETELNFAWYTNVEPTGVVVQVAEQASMVGEVFPEEHATSFQGEAATASEGFYSNKAVVTNLRAATTYVYRLGDGNPAHWSPVYTFTTRNTDVYSFMFVGDPQIGSSNVTTDTYGWTNTLNKATEMFPNYSFIMSAGDQVERATNETEYAGYLQPEVLRHMPVANTVGNHDNNVNYRYHFNQPNESDQYGVTSAGGNYYYTYGDTLFMVLNSNNSSAQGHKQFMVETMAAHPDARWTFVTMHHSIYSAANHSTSDSIINFRKAMFPVFDELEIDIVFMGHDHSYVRSHHMIGDLPQHHQIEDEDGSVINPQGTLYLTANSSSGSKYYALKDVAEPYSAVRSQIRIPTFATVHVTPTSVEMTTYRTDTMEAVDTYKIIKDASIEMPVQELSDIQLSADGDSLITGPHGLDKKIQLSIEGINQNGQPMNLPNIPLEFKTDKPGVLAIAPNGQVTLDQAPTQNQSVQVWVEVSTGGQKLESNKITIEVIHVAEKILLHGNTSWKYLDDGSNQGTAWRAVDFDDSSWRSGSAPLGYPATKNTAKFGNIRTTISFGPDSGNKYITSYFRTELMMSQFHQAEAIIGTFGIDDGVVLYVNGEEAYRWNMPEGEINYLTHSATTIGDPRTEVKDLTHVMKSLLREGRNVLAAEVHQRDGRSSDLYWDMELTALLNKDIPLPETSSLKIFAKDQRVIQEESSEVSFYLAMSQLEKMNSLDTTVDFDPRVLQFKKAEVVYPHGETIMDAKVNEAGDEVRIVAGFVQPITSVEEVELFKITFEVVDQQATELLARVEVQQSHSASSGEHQKRPNALEEASASIQVVSYKALSDLNGDGVVDIEDLSIALDFYRATIGDANWSEAQIADINGDGVVDLTDFSILILYILHQK